MNEKPIEWFTTVGENIIHRIFKFFFLIAAAISFIVTFMVASLLPLIPLALFAVLFLVFYLYGFVEYSFILVGDDMRVSTVYNNNRRKLKLEFTLNQVERIEQGISPYAIEPVWLCAKNGPEEKYTMLLHMKDERKTLIFEADPEFLEVMKRRRLLK